MKHLLQNAIPTTGVAQMAYHINCILLCANCIYLLLCYPGFHLQWFLYCNFAIIAGTRGSPTDFYEDFSIYTQQLDLWNHGIVSMITEFVCIVCLGVSDASVKRIAVRSILKVVTELKKWHL